MKAKDRLAVAIEHENYRCLTMPFSFIDASGIFAKAIYIAFRELLDIITSYFDNVTIIHNSYDPEKTHQKPAEATAGERSSDL